jgi:hypothetical protein
MRKGKCVADWLSRRGAHGRRDRIALAVMSLLFPVHKDGQRRAHMVDSKFVPTLDQGPAELNMGPPSNA